MIRERRNFYNEIIDYFQSHPFFAALWLLFVAVTGVLTVASSWISITEEKESKRFSDSYYAAVGILSRGEECDSNLRNSKGEAATLEDIKVCFNIFSTAFEEFEEIKNDTSCPCNVRRKSLEKMLLIMTEYVGSGVDIIKEREKLKRELNSINCKPNFFSYVQTRFSL